jgi:hypothetical protein
LAWESAVSSRTSHERTPCSAARTRWMRSSQSAPPGPSFTREVALYRQRAHHLLHGSMSASSVSVSQSCVLWRTTSARGGGVLGLLPRLSGASAPCHVAGVLAVAYVCHCGLSLRVLPTHALTARSLAPVQVHVDVGDVHVRCHVLVNTSLQVCFALRVCHLST